jgi:hypothetical protein
MKIAEAKMIDVRQIIEQKTKEKDVKILEVQTPIKEELRAVDLEAQQLGELRAQTAVIAAATAVSGKGSRGYNASQISKAKSELPIIDEKIRENVLKKASLNTKLGEINTCFPVLELIDEIENIKTTQLDPATRMYTEKKSAYDTAKSAAEQSRARANKTPDPTTAARKSLGEILGDDSTATPTKKMSGSGV